MLKRLVVPLLLLSMASFVSSYFVRNVWRDLLVNLTATFVGIVLTVAYIDRVLQRQREMEWQGMRSRAAKRLFGLANSFITSIRTALKVGPEVVDGDGERTDDLTILRTRMMRVADNILPQAISRVDAMTTADWRQFQRALLAGYEIADRLLGLFGRYFPPRIAELVLDIESAAQNAMYAYSVYPDLVGVAVENLPQRRDGSSSLPIQQATYRLTERNMLKLLTLCSQLLAQLEDLPNDFD